MYLIIQEVTSMITVLDIVRFTGLIFATIYAVNRYISQYQREPSRLKMIIHIVFTSINL